MAREKEKLRSDLEKAEKLKSLMASEVDDHHAAIERRNEYNLRYGIPAQPSPLLWDRRCGIARSQVMEVEVLCPLVATKLDSQRRLHLDSFSKLFFPVMSL